MRAHFDPSYAGRDTSTAGGGNVREPTATERGRPDTASMKSSPPVVADDRFDFVIIGSGGAGEAAAHLAAARGARVAIVEKELVGGSCPFWACMPSKTLLHDAHIHALDTDLTWPKASDRRDYMIVREGTDWPDDGGHVRSLEQDGVTVVRGLATVVGKGRVSVKGDDFRRDLQATHIVVAIGTQATIPEIEGLDQVQFWTNREGTSARELPRSLLILGGGPTGLELAQVYARFGVPVTLIHPYDRLNQKDHPRNSAAVEQTLLADGVTIVKSARATRVVPAPSSGGEHRIELSRFQRLRTRDPRRRRPDGAARWAGPRKCRS